MEGKGPEAVLAPPVPGVKMRVLGVDPGLAVTGYGLVSTGAGGSWMLEEAGIIRSPAGKDVSRRVQKIHLGIQEIIREGRPEVLVLEELYSHYRHPRTAIIMGHARGVVCLAAAEAGIALVSYSATRVKKAVCGSGHASKEQVMHVVQSLLRLKQAPAVPDVTDALALAITHLNLSRHRI